MGSSRECAFTGLRHPPCAACGEFITRRSRHVHAYGDAASSGECVCGECYAITALAAIPVLRAAEKLGIEPSYKNLHAALKKGHIFVLAQGSLEVSLN